MEPVRPRYLLCVHCDPPCFRANIDEYGKHVTVKHGGRSSLNCGQCLKSFVHKTSLMRHIKEQHIKRNAEEESETEAEEGLGSGPPTPPSPPSRSHSETAENASDGTGNQEDHPNPNDIQTEAAMFLLKLRSSGNMTNASVSIVQCYVGELLINILKNVEQTTSQFLSDCGVNPDQANAFLSGPTFHVGNPFENMATVEEQLHFFCEKYGLVIPEEKLLSSRIENRFDRARRLNLILSEKASADGMYRSYMDGTEFANNPFLQKYPNAIRIILYYDDLEISAALGSKDGIHKLGCFYFAIQNFPPEESSLLSSLYLLALAYAEDLKKPGAFRKVLFLADMERLCSDEGVLIDLPNGDKFILRAIFVTVCADALAAHALLGLLSPSPNRFCRLCLVTKADIKNDSTFIGIMRTAQLHEQHVRDVLEGRAQPKLYGVKEESPLKDVMEVPQGSCFDAFHDLVGVIQMVLKLALYEYICVRKLFKCEDFNSYLNMFVYGAPDVKNKPSPNILYSKLCGKGHSLKQYGSQTFCLLRIFPFVIKGVEEGDEILELVFLLQDIVKLILSPTVSPLDVLHLENLIRRHNQRFHELFVTFEDPDLGIEGGEDDDEEEEEDLEENVDDPAENAGDEAQGQQSGRGRRRKRMGLKKGINKLHHLLHYPQQMRDKGPVGRLWTAKFEARHRIFRKHSAVQSNFKNPPQTMAKMFQLSTLGAILSSTTWRKPVLAGRLDELHVEHSPYCGSLLQMGLSANDVILVAKSVELCGIEYSVDLFVQLKDNSSLLPSFAIILDVIQPVKNQEIVILAVAKCKNNGLSLRFNSYHISNKFDEESTLVELTNLASHRVIAPWNPVQDSVDGTVNLYLYPRYV
ncbi:Zinc finger and BTB domain-containing protein 12 [Frankliniella fusca]|uniref:Zinc finger and BTB domain-containing protein 12 n=1 Tax=Frankliniella fusca TaxID=407009 RepID=A0AAE1LDZ5_9NEOP|nr:Zinc finger and BTB domain-containing protein 12 [Frankliniella fusca]